MWLIDNQTPFAVERGWVRDRSGAEVWLVAVKCTFDVHPDGACVISDVQPPVLRTPQYKGEPARSSLLFDADLVLTKTTTDVTVLGHAHAPDGQRVESMMAGLRIGSLQKWLKITGDRVWTSAGPTHPRPFTIMPLEYERAFGGVDRHSTAPERDYDWRNPIGTGFVVGSDHAIGVPLPNIEYPTELITRPADRPAPAGFGPVPPNWQSRAMFAGTYDETWLAERQPLLPVDFDDRYFQAAPADQQPADFLRGGESVELVGLTRVGPLRFGLPVVTLGFESRFDDGSIEHHAVRRLHSVIIESDFPRVSLVWHSALPCHFKAYKLSRTIVIEKRRVNSAEPLMRLA